MSKLKTLYCLCVCSSALMMLPLQSQEVQPFAEDLKIVPVKSTEPVQSSEAFKTQEQILAQNANAVVTSPTPVVTPQVAVAKPALLAQATVAQQPQIFPATVLANMPLSAPTPSANASQINQPIIGQSAVVQGSISTEAPSESVPVIKLAEAEQPHLIEQPVVASQPDYSSTKKLRGGDYIKDDAVSSVLSKKPITIIPPSPMEQQQKIELEQEDEEDALTQQEQNSTNYAYLGKFLKPWELITHDKLIEINFENAQLMNLIQYFEKEYGLTFILDNVIEPMADGGKNPVGIRFSFKTEKPLNTKQAWDLFVSFLDMAGLMVIPGPGERIYQITSNKADSKFSTSKEPIPTFVGIDTSLLPTSDIKIRYVYFIQNTTVDTVKSVVEKLRSPISSPPILVGELNALILTDRASNIQTILMILKELDKPILPETLTVLKLKKTEADKVKTLYDNLVNEEKNLFPRLAPWARKQSIGYFTENVRLIADRRTNSLIILGPRQNVKKIEDFILKEIDREIDLPYSPLHVYPLKYIDAAATAQIINDLKAGFQSGTTAGQYGGLLGGTRFLKPTVTITAEKSNNSLIINADYDDYLQIFELLEKIDVEQPQVAIRILVLDVNLTDSRKFGMQLRTPVPFLGDGTGVNFQNSGLPITDTTSSSLVQNFTPSGTPTQASLLGDLINLVVGQEAGSTILTLPTDAFGIYGVLKALQNITNVSVIAKPFLVTSHKYNASINIAETRRVTTANVVGGGGTPTQQSQGDLSAGLVISVSPQISPDDYVTLTVSVEDSQFTAASTASSTTDFANGNRNVKRVTSNVILGDNQVLALGGIIIDRELELIYKVPLLGDIPLLGWFFKSKSKVIQKTSLLILISAQIVRPQAQELIDGFTKQRFNAAKEILNHMDGDDQGRDPVHRWFFQDHDNRYQDDMNKILSTAPGTIDKKSETKNDEMRTRKQFKIHASSEKKEISAPSNDKPEKSSIDESFPAVNTAQSSEPLVSSPDQPGSVSQDGVTKPETAVSFYKPEPGGSQQAISGVNLPPIPVEHRTLGEVVTAQSSTDQSVIEKPLTEQSLTGQSLTEQPKKVVEQPVQASSHRRRLREFIPPSVGGAGAS